MKCKYCGENLNEGSLFCNKCGMRVEVQEIIETNEQTKGEVIVESNDVEKDTEKVNEELSNLTLLQTLLTFIKRNKVMSVLVVLTIIFVIVVVCITSSTPQVNDNYNDDNEYNGYEDVQSSSVDVGWITDRRVQYDSANEEYIVFFGLKDYNEEYVASKGTAKIIINDETGNELYNKEINFTEADFTSWTNQTWDEPKYMCGLYIKKSDIAGSATSTGVLSLTVECENASFDPDNISIYDLPSKQLSIQLPSTPTTIYNYGYKGNTETIVSVEKISYESESNYDGRATVTFKMNVKLIANYSDSTGPNSRVGYKLKNSEGIIVDSGHFYIAPMEVGEVVAEEAIVFDVDPNDSYTLTFENTK